MCLIVDEQTKASEKALVMMVQGLKKSQFVQQNDLGMPHTNRTIIGQFLKTIWYKVSGKLVILMVDWGLTPRKMLTHHWITGDHRNHYVVWLLCQ